MSPIILAMLLAGSAATEPNVVVVCPPAFLDALAPWLAHRRSQGHRLRIVSETGSAQGIRDEIRQTARAGALRHIVLVGDVDPLAATSKRGRRRSTPTHRAAAQVTVHWGSEPDIATDNWYADLDDDQVPDVAIGRLSADSVAELLTIVKKTLHYERARRTGLWRRRVNFVAGVGGFGALADTVLETATKKFLKDLIPPEYAVSMTYGSWRSPYCPDPRRFHQATVDRFNEGCLFWVYIGHGQRTFLDRVRVPGAAHHIFDADDIPKLQSRGPAPIAVFLSCYAGAFDEPRECLAELMLRSARGPVAVLSGSRMTMPYAMAVMGNALMDECFQNRSETIGDVVLHAKRRMAAPADPDAPADSNRVLLDAIAGAISPAADQLEEERLEHLLLFNLLGDPLLRLDYPLSIPIETSDEVRAGKSLNVTFASERDGLATVELVCRRDSTRLPPPRRASYVPTDDALGEYSRVYDQANDHRWAARTFQCRAGESQTTLAVPANARGPCYVRVFIEQGDRFGLGAAKVYVRRPAKRAER